MQALVINVVLRRTAEVAESAYYNARFFAFMLFIVGMGLTIIWPRHDLKQRLIGIVLNIVPFWLFLLTWSVAIAICHIDMTDAR